jgi:hypothetical protein
VRFTYVTWCNLIQAPSTAPTMFPLTATIVSPSFEWAGQPNYINSLSGLQLYAVSTRAR